MEINNSWFPPGDKDTWESDLRCAYLDFVKNNFYWVFIPKTIH